MIGGNAEADNIEVRQVKTFMKEPPGLKRQAPQTKKRFAVLSDKNDEPASLYPLHDNDAHHLHVHDALSVRYIIFYM